MSSTDTPKLLEKARHAIHAAETLLQNDEVESAAGRAYYAMFYTAEALLSHKGLHSRKHGGVHALFGQQFIKTGLMEERFHRSLLDAFDRRIQADYGLDVTLGREEVAGMVAEAREFLKAAEALLGFQT